MIQAIRRQGRIIYDSFFCKNIDTKATLGGENAGDSWTVIAKFLNNSSIVYSGGVGKDISFELKLAKQFKPFIYLYDPSPTGIETIKKLGILPEKVIFYPLGLSKENGTFSFDNPFWEGEGSFILNQTSQNTINSFTCQNIETCMKNNGHTKIDLLKIDIEGSEYGVIEEIIEKNITIDQICVEIHTFAPFSRPKRQELVKKMENFGYLMFHKKGADFCFIKKSLLAK
jgi:FkbM family methyltransferase